MQLLWINTIRENTMMSSVIQMTIFTILFCSQLFFHYQMPLCEVFNKIFSCAHDVNWGEMKDVNTHVEIK